MFPGFTGLWTFDLLGNYPPTMMIMTIDDSQLKISTTKKMKKNGFWLTAWVTRPEHPRAQRTKSED